MHSSRSPGIYRLGLFIVTLVALLTAGLAIVTPASAAEGLLSQGRAAFTSSSEGGSFSASAAFDGNSGTRWASAQSDPQWIQVDLAATATINKVVLAWEGAYGRAFKIQTSPDGSSWTDIYSTTTGTGGTQTLNISGTGRHVRMYGTARGTGYGFSLWEFEVHGTANGQPTLPPPSPPPAEPSTHHEFQANCSVTDHRPDDPIVFPGLPGASHMHTFVGNRTTNAASTASSLLAGGTSCTNHHDKSAYWWPSLYKNNQLIAPVGPQVIYYKSGVTDYTTVKTFPPGMRFVVGSPTATLAEFRDSPGTVEGYECGDSVHNYDLPASCPAGSRLNVRYQAPSCWDGVNLDSANHKSHMAYPVNGQCTISHPVPVPMLEFKIAFPADGDLSQARLSSGRGYTWHYDFFNAWKPEILQALVTHCVNGGLQCNPRGYDQYKPYRGAALTENYELP